MIPKKYFHDRIILLLLSSNVFVAVLSVILIVLRLDLGRPGTYIVQYRQNYNRFDVAQGGTVSTFLAFIALDVLVLLFHTVLSVRVFKIKRQLAVLVLAMGLLLLIFSLIVSYTLIGAKT